MQKIVSIKCRKCSNKDSFTIIEVIEKVKIVPKSTLAINVVTTLILIDIYLDNLRITLVALSMVYIDKNPFRNIALILRVINNVKVPHTTISNWCEKFATFFNNISL